MVTTAATGNYGNNKSYIASINVSVLTEKLIEIEIKLLSPKTDSLKFLSFARKCSTTRDLGFVGAGCRSACLKCAL